MVRVLQEAAGELTTSPLTDVVLPLALAFIMLGMGLGLRGAHFRLLVTQPRGVIAGLIGQVLLLPVLGTMVAAAAVAWFGWEVELALGLVLLASVPGGATSNMLTWLSRGDTALSVTLTAFTSLGSFLLTPTVLYLSTLVLWGSGEGVSIPLGQVLGLTFGVIAVPVLIGMWVGHKAPRFAVRADKPLRIFGIVFLTVLIAGIIAQNREGFWGFAAATVPASLALNGLALGAGFLVAWLFRLPEAQRRSAVIEVGFQNGTFAILLAISQLESARAALVPGFYSLVMYATGAVLAVYWTRKGAPEATVVDVAENQPDHSQRSPARPLPRHSG